MKIINIEVEIKSIPLKTPFITALRHVQSVEFVRVTLSCENGGFGIGEAPATKAITGEGIEEIVASIKSVQSLLNFHMPSEALLLLHSTCQIGSSAKAALDMALHTLIAQAHNIPMYKYFGLCSPISLQSDITISLNDPKKMLEDAKSAYEDGMWILKLKFGSDIAHAILVTRSISHELPHAKLLIDANQAWQVEETLHYIQSLQDVTIELIEQPVIASDLAGLKTITEATTIAIVADEAVFTLADAKQVIQTKSANIINIKLMKCGGVTKAIEILEFCKKSGVKCMLGSMLESPRSINIALHLAMAYSDVIAYIDLDSPLLYKEPSRELEFRYEGCVVSYN